MNALLFPTFCPVRAATGCIHHSDRGSQYASDAYQVALSKAQLRCSMTNGYDCYRQCAGRAR